MTWTVQLTKKAQKQQLKLPQKIRLQLFVLFKEIELEGPVRGNWKNYGKLKGLNNRHHCHIKSGKPTYVVCWQVVNNIIQVVEIYYVGTHEKAPY